MNFRMKTSGQKREKKNIFCKLNKQNQHFLDSCIYNDNKNIFIKKR